MNALRLAARLHTQPLIRRKFSSSPYVLSGHNKWSKIKQKKGANDLQKGALYSRAFKDIALAVRTGGSADPVQNTSLAAVIKRVRAQGVPKDNVENALKKASGAKEKGETHLLFEVMGPGSVGIIVECLSDNPNRTIKDLNNTLKNNGCRMADVQYLFRREGRVAVSLPADADAEALIQHALDAGAEDFELDEDPPEGTQRIEFTCQQTDLHKLTTALSAPEVACELLDSELVYTPNEVREDLDDATTTALDKLVQAIDDAEDTLQVWTTADK